VTIRNKDKDHLREHGGIELVVPAVAPPSDDPLRFWTGHLTENTLLDLHEFADGVHESGNPTGGGSWTAAFTARPELIAELSPAIQARLTLMTAATCQNYQTSLRKFWRACDQLEATVAPDGRTLGRLTSVLNLNHLHEAAMHLAQFDRIQFGTVLNLLNDTRRLMRLRPLLWATPKGGEPDRQLIPDSHAKALRIAIKRDWERIRKTWERNDAIRRGDEPNTLTEYEKQDSTVVQAYAEQNEILRQHWLYFKRIQESSVTHTPTGEELSDGKTKKFHQYRGLYWSTMRAIAFPTLEEANIAFHAALMRSGWNPSTLITGIDATLPNSIFLHPKDAKQSVLLIDAEEGSETKYPGDLEEFNMHGSKRRAGGRLQFCMGLKKDPDSPPNIVSAYLERTKELRTQLHHDVEKAHAEYQRLQKQDSPTGYIALQFKRLQKLQQGTRNVWLYIDYKGRINWLDGLNWSAFYSSDTNTSWGKVTYLKLVIKRLNVQREKRQEEPIALVTPSDFRDLYARWVYLQTGGNILSVMIALGHAKLKSTDGYLTNNIYGAENDEAVRSFMTHLLLQLSIGRLDLTILAQLVRHGPMNEEMHARLAEYRGLTRSRVNIACTDIKNPPPNIDPDHVPGKRCGTHRCLRDCPHARYLPESIDGISMRVEELLVISDNLPLDTWIKGGFEKELEAGEYLLTDLYAQDDVIKARTQWREKILSGMHLVPGIGFFRQQEAA
jgi:hypothetical protein